MLTVAIDGVEVGEIPMADILPWRAKGWRNVIDRKRVRELATANDRREDRPGSLSEDIDKLGPGIKRMEQLIAEEAETVLLTDEHWILIGHAARIASLKTKHAKLTALRLRTRGRASDEHIALGHNLDHAAEVAKRFIGHCGRAPGGPHAWWTLRTCDNKSTEQGSVRRRRRKGIPRIAAGLLIDWPEDHDIQGRIKMGIMMINSLEGVRHAETPE